MDEVVSCVVGTISVEPSRAAQEPTAIRDISFHSPLVMEGRARSPRQDFLSTEARE
jgi:hypothetical protein